MKNILKKTIDDKIQFIDLQFTDIFGNLKTIEIPQEDLEDSIKRGVWFDGSSIKGFARLKESDMYLKPDLDTYAVIPGDKEDKKTARFLCDVYSSDGELFEGDPRAILKKVMGEAKDLGYEFKVGPEVEFYLFKRNDEGKLVIPDYDNGGYFDNTAGDLGSKVRKEIMVQLKEFGIKPERAHHEVGAGQHEIGFKYGDPLKTADRVITLKQIIKYVAHKHDLVASFMPKPLYQKAGNGMHIHFSLFGEKGEPLFYEENDKHHLSELAKKFIAGELKYASEMTAILNPTVNSYKRLVPGYEAPVYICWGGTNRSSLVRIPRYTKGRESSVRGEIRCPDPSASPYLAFAAILKSGLAGVYEELELMPEMDDSAFELTKEELAKKKIKTLPGSLEESVQKFKKSRIMKEVLGDKLFEEYTQAKENESEEYKIAVTDWEVEKYIDSC